MTLTNPTPATPSEKPVISAAPAVGRRKALVVDVQLLNQLSSKSSKKIHSAVLDTTENNVQFLQNMEILKVILPFLKNIFIIFFLLPNFLCRFTQLIFRILC